MSQPETILDYASPRKRTALRMASRSLLDLECVEDGVVVREHLAEQGQALGVILGSTVVILMMVLMLVGEWHRTPRGFMVIPAILVLSWAIVVPLVIQGSWSR